MYEAFRRARHVDIDDLVTGVDGSPVVVFLGHRPVNV